MSLDKATLNTVEGASSGIGKAQAELLDLGHLGEGTTWCAARAGTADDSRSDEAYHFMVVAGGCNALKGKQADAEKLDVERVVG